MVNRKYTIFELVFFEGGKIRILAHICTKVRISQLFLFYFSDLIRFVLPVKELFSPRGRIRIAKSELFSFSEGLDPDPVKLNPVPKLGKIIPEPEVYLSLSISQMKRASFIYWRD